MRKEIDRRLRQCGPCWRDIVSDREWVGWTQAELARRAGIRVATLNRIETGKHTPSVASIEKIDAALQAASRRSKRRAKPN